MACCGRNCLGWMIQEMELDLADELSDSGEVVAWNFARDIISRIKIRNHQSPHCLRVPEDDEECTPCQRNTPQYFWKMFVFLTNSFEVFNLRDRNIAADLFHCAFHYVIANESSVVFESYRDDSDTDGIFSEADFRKLMTIPYPVEDVEHWQSKIVWTVAKTGRELFLRSLLKHGALYLLPDDERFPYIEYCCDFKYLLFQIEGRYNKNCSKNIQRFCNKRFCSKRFFNRPIPNRRVPNVLRIVEILAEEMFERHVNSRPQGPRRKRPRIDPEEDSRTPGSARFRCLRMVFDTIPDPIVTSQELRKMIKKACSGFWDRKPKLKMDGLISEFERLYPESMGPLAPRSLKHLSRCAVREALRQSRALPNGVRELNIPICLRKYILLEE